MPILKIPVEHNFGIISLSQVGGILTKSKGKNVPKRPKSALFPEINQDFISKYNGKPKDARAPLDAAIRSVLQHAKYKTGLVHSRGTAFTSRNTSIASSRTISAHTLSRRPGGSPLIDSAPHDFSSIWLQLVLLSQCQSPLQQEVLLTLSKSLNHCPVSPSHIPSLIYIAGLCYQWLKSDTLTDNLLRTGELLLLKVIYLVALRLYYHHLSGRLMDCCTREEIRQVKYDLEGFDKKEEVYRSMPEAFLHWKFALETGQLICDHYYSNKLLHSSHIPSLVRSSENTKEKSARKKSIPSVSSRTSCGGGHDMYGVLWHSLDIWQSTQQDLNIIPDVIQDFLACSTEFHKDRWLDGLLAMSILCTASQCDLSILKFVQSLARKPSGSHTPQRTDMAKKKATFKLAATAKQTQLLKMPAAGVEVAEWSHSLLQGHAAASRAMPTLNMLGVQPDFNIPDGESVYTAADHTVSSYEATHQGSEDGGGSRTNVLAQPCASMEYIGPRPDTLTLESVGTQSLLDNESIPDQLPSAITSNITFLDAFESAMSLESMGKSGGLLYVSNTSKNLDISFSNLVSSPCVLPSGELIENENADAAPPFDANVSSDPTPGGVKPVATSEALIATSTATKLSEGSKRSINLLSNDRVQQQVRPQQVKIVSIPESEQRCAESRCTHYTHSTAPIGTGANVLLGSQVHPSTILRNSFLSGDTFGKMSEVLTETTLPIESTFEKWPKEVALAYVTGMADCAIHGQTSLIQKMAMDGLPEPEVGVVKSDPRERGHGLLDLTKFQIVEPEDTNSDHSWCIRYVSIMGLTRVNRVCQLVPLKDDLSTTAWSKLIERQATETDPRVLGAFNMAQISPDMDSSPIEMEDRSFSCPLMAHIANGLSSFFMPLQTVITPISQSVLPITSKYKDIKPVQRKRMDLDRIRSRVDTRLEQSQSDHPLSFNARMLEKIQEIAEMDWKRALEQEKQAEEQEEEKLEEGRMELSNLAEGERVKKKADMHSSRRKRVTI